MAILTEQIPATSLNLTDFVHIARPEDLSQSYNGSSYKATIAQLIDAENCCISSGTFSYEEGSLDLYGITGTLSFTVNGFTAFSGGSENCINNLYLNNIYPCVQHIFVQPAADGNTNKSTIFGVDSTYTPMTILHTESGNGSTFKLTKLGINNNNINTRSTFHFYSPGGLSEFRYYDNLKSLPGASPANLFDDFHEIITLSIGNPVSTAMKVKSESGTSLLIGAIDPLTVLSSSLPFGDARDTFLAKTGNGNGMNIISTNPTNDSGFISFILNGDFANTNPSVYINGDSPTQGFMGVGNNNITPTSLLDISGVGSAVGTGTLGFNQLRLRTPYTVPKSSEITTPVGTVCWDNDYLYIKVIAAQWRRLSLSSF